MDNDRQIAEIIVGLMEYGNPENELTVGDALNVLNKAVGDEATARAYEISKTILSNQKYKQIIVLRKDLNMRKGKMVAQGAHASMKATLLHLEDPRVAKWLDGPFAKIAVSVDSEQELLELAKEAKEAGLICEEIVDSGKTEFGGVPTRTALGIGPDISAKLDPITGHLKLL